MPKAAFIIEKASPLLYEVLPPEAKHTQNPYTTRGLSVSLKKAQARKPGHVPFLLH